MHRGASRQPDRPVSTWFEGLQWLSASIEGILVNYAAAGIGVNPYQYKSVSTILRRDHLTD